MTSGSSGPLIPFITTEQMRDVDQLMEEEYGILLVQMMENAGRSLASLAWSRFLETAASRNVIVLAGRGGNGGGGMASARHLSNWGANVTVVTAAPPSRFAGVPRTQLRILKRMGIPFSRALDGIPPVDLIVDALIGYSLQGAPAGDVARLIWAANAHGSPILSLDVPSGVGATTGEVHDPAIRAVATMTLALPKTGLRQPGAAPYVGELYLADIGVPPSLYGTPPLELTVGPIFAKGDILRLS